MSEKKVCDMSLGDAEEKGYDLCRLLSAVEAAKSDMEYNCCRCENK